MSAVATPRKTVKRKVKSQFTKDEYGEKVLLKNGAVPVAMKWEQPYIKASITALKPSGNVLEVGFGLGYAAKFIQKFNPTSHTIIEHDPVVLKKLHAWAKKHPNVRIIDRPWQEVVDQLNAFDAIYFNDYEPLSEYDMDQLREHLVRSKGAAEKTLQLRRDLLSAVKQFHGVQFTDPELKEFLQTVWDQPNVSGEQVLDFLELLAESQHITDAQKELAVQEVERQLAKSSIPQKRARTPWMQHKSLSVSRLIDFAVICLRDHMKPGARLSGFVGSAEPLSNSPEFNTKILSRPDVRFKENAMHVIVPPNCTYFSGDKALVIVIEKK